MNTDLYDPKGKNPKRVQRHLTNTLSSTAGVSRTKDTEAAAAKQAMYDAIEAAHGVTAKQRGMGLLSASQIATATGLTVKRIEQILKERREQRKGVTDAAEVAAG